MLMIKNSNEDYLSTSEEKLGIFDCQKRLEYFFELV
jgi:hypothetical protein